MNPTAFRTLGGASLPDVTVEEMRAAEGRRRPGQRRHPRLAKQGLTTLDSDLLLAAIGLPVCVYAGLEISLSEFDGYVLRITSG